MSAHMNIIHHYWPYGLQLLDEQQLKRLAKYTAEHINIQALAGVSFLSSGVMQPYKFERSSNIRLSGRPLSRKWFKSLQKSAKRCLRYRSLTSPDRNNSVWSIKPCEYKNAELWLPRRGEYRVSYDNPTLAIDIVYHKMWEWLQENCTPEVASFVGEELITIVEVEGEYLLYSIGAGGPVRDQLWVMQRDMVPLPDGMHKYSILNIFPAPGIAEKILERKRQ